MMTTQAIMMTVQIESTYPWTRTAGFAPTAIGQKLSRTLMNPAVKVVVETKQSGTKVIHAYFARPMLMMIVVPTASAWC